MSTLADRLQIWGFEENFMIYSDNSLGFMLDCIPVDISTWSDDRANAFSDRVSQLLNGLPASLDIQFVQDIVPGNDKTLSSYLQLSNISQNKIVKQICSQRVSSLKELDDLGLLPRHGLKIIVRKPMRELLAKPKLFSREKLFKQVTEENLSREIESLSRIKDNLISELISMGLDAKELSSDEIAALLYDQWNPSRGVPFKSYDPEEVRQSLLFSDVGVDINGFVIGSSFFRVLSLKTLPSQTYSGMAAALRDLPFKSRLYVTIHSPDQTKEIERLQLQRRVAFSMVVGKKSGVSDIESKAKLEDLEGLLEQMIAQGQKVFHVSINVVLQHKNELELEAQADLVLAKFRELAGSEAMSETLASFDIFSEIALPNARAKERTKKIKTGNLCDLLPLYGPWPGHKQPSILLKSRAGSLLSLNPFDKSLTNANQLVSGGSGSGKSFMMNMLLLQMLKENPKVFFIDIGGSYQKLTENLEGQYVSLGVNEDLSINPFDLGPNETLPSSKKIKFILGLVELMVKEADSVRLPKLARTIIEEGIQTVYKTCKNPKLSDLRDYLVNADDIEIKSYGKILNSWCGESAYGKFIDRPTTVELHKDIVAFDLKGLENYPDLQSVCLYIITDLVWREVQKDKSKMKFLVFDECWKLLKDESGIVFIEEVFRTFRKYHASAVAISQDLNDFIESKIASALLPNCSLKWILKQNQNDFTKMSEALGLNENESDLIRSLTQVKGEFSEVFLLCGNDRRTVAVIEPSSLELWIGTTDPPDIAEFEKAKLAHPNLSQFEILNMLAKKFPKGVSQSLMGA